ncbi:hypothetical protein EYF80_021304 [Liparis tanakae]|uniref:Uncharacterized protein n=1 Tax=Liparis tanakae TaxID=230148 RepID=A0A4Z2HRP2_9TELE|nr:hypothetical protein EYF80_021304 [Liparis tanakae]
MKALGGSEKRGETARRYPAGNLVPRSKEPGVEEDKGVYLNRRSRGSGIKALLMKGNVCTGMAWKCSGSRMAHLILPDRKESESNEKRGGGAAVRVVVVQE